MDEYIDQLLTEIPDKNSALHHVVQKILDEPIPDFVKGRLLKPLQPGNYRPSPAPRKKKASKRKGILEEFDPLPHQKAVQTVQEQKKRHELVFYRTPWVIGSFLQGWQMDICEGHPSGFDVRAFMQEVESRIHDKLEEEILALNSIKFQHAVKVQLRKDNPSSEEYTDPVLRHKQEALLQASEINEDLNKATPTSWSCSKSGHREGRGGWSKECRLSGWTSLDISH